MSIQQNPCAGSSSLLIEGLTRIDTGAFHVETKVPLLADSEAMHGCG